MGPANDKHHAPTNGLIYSTNRIYSTYYNSHYYNKHRKYIMLIACKFPEDKLISSAEQTDLSFNPLCINAFFLLALYIKLECSFVYIKGTQVMISKNTQKNN